MNDKYDGVLKELAALLVPHLVPTITSLVHDAMGTLDPIDRKLIDEVVQAKIDDLTQLDKDAIREVCEEVIDAQDIDDKINDWMQSNWDIADYQSEIQDMVDVNEAVESHLNTYLHDEVVNVVQGLRFNVEVSSR
jgi:hypothetical protein